jgi:hypothetical protein
MKKALAGPAKRTTKRLPERRAMIAAVRRRLGQGLARVEKATRVADHWAAGRLEKAWPPLRKRALLLRVAAFRLARRVGRRLRPLAVLVLRGFARGERGLRRAAAWAARTATRASGVITPRRAAAGLIIASAVILLVAQFVAYHGVEIGQPGYAGLPAAEPPTVATEDAGQAHSYLLVPVALAAALVGLLALRRERRGLGRIAVGLGLLSLAVILAVDLPAGLDEGAESSRFSGATAVLAEGFYTELAAAAGLVFGGLLYTAPSCLTRINLSGRVASVRRRRRRRRDSSRGRAARRPSPRRSAAASAPASRP